MPNAKVLIFDFDGTLADTAPIILKVYSEIAKKNNLRPITKKDYAELRKGSLGQARRWTGIRIWQFPLVVRSVKRLMGLESSKVQLFPGASELIDDLHDQNISMYILSRNTSDTINRVLRRYDLEDKIKVLPRRKSSFGSKTRAISLFVRSNNLDKQSVWMIGDETRDIQAAKRAGVNSIAVTWGLQDESILKTYKPTHTVHTMTELGAIIRSLI